MTVTEDNYKEIMLKRATISCWVILGICFVIKICGGHFFNIVCNIQWFIKFSNFVDNTILRYILFYCFFMFSSYLLLLIVKPDLKLFSLKSLIYFICCNIVWIIKLLIEKEVIIISMIGRDVIDFASLFMMLSSISRKIKDSIIAIILLFVFTLISAIVKNIAFEQVITTSFLVDSIFMIDYYIMLVLRMLYVKKKNLKRR